MPRTEMKVKSGATYPVSYCVTGSMSDLTREQLEAIAIKQIRQSARAYVLAKLNEVEPAIANNVSLFTGMVESGICDEEKAKAFFSSKGLVLEVPSSFEIDLEDILPKESTRGKKAANVFDPIADDDYDEDDANGENPTE